jgi:uncharacterized membrane protein YcaP (DUF421 family)
MRLPSNRMAAQLTLFELSTVVTMAAVIGIPLQVPDRGLLTLRAQGVEHLGQVRRVYLEPSGDLSLIKYERQRPGLLIIPESDSSHGRYERAEDHYACSNCGNVVVSDHEPLDYCDSCGEPRWTEAG